METVDCIVAGAGVVGLAIARELAGRGHEVLILEAADAIGIETSSRNSEVIHAGIYYPKDSLKAQLCVQGRHLLYAYLDTRGIPHRRCGKLIVANGHAQVAQLAGIAAHAARCGVDDLQLLDADAARVLEPQLACEAALLSPSTGILDSHALMLSLLGDAEAAGAVLALNTRIVSGAVEPGGFRFETLDATDEMQFRLGCRLFVNTAGLGANALARSIAGMPAVAVPDLHMARGSYFALPGQAPFSHLVYPVPEPGGLGVHLTLDMGGGMRFGPDVEWIQRKDYAVDPARADRFHAAVRSYWPALPANSLQPAYSGIRPKLSGPGEPAADFRIDSEKTHGIPGLVNLFGIESPGLTSSLAIARHVAGLVG